MAKGNSTRSVRTAASCVCRERRIKVHQKFYEYRGTKRDPYRCLNRSVPWVQLRGDWLQAAGFAIDTPIQVRVMRGCLVLTVIQQEREE